jgi:hypothetical protein
MQFREMQLLIRYPLNEYGCGSTRLDGVEYTVDRIDSGNHPAYQMGTGVRYMIRCRYQ